MRDVEKAVQILNAKKHPDVSKVSALDLLREIFRVVGTVGNQIPDSNPFDVCVNVQILRRFKELHQMDLAEKFEKFVKEYDTDVIHTCVVTGKVFSSKEAEMEITQTRQGPMWMGLWSKMDEPIIFDDEDWTLIPRWMLPALHDCHIIPNEDELESADPKERERLLERMKTR